MTAITHDENLTEGEPAPVAGRTNYLNASHGLKSWLLTVDHKRIAILYLLGITFFFAFGGIFAVLLRVELSTPGPLFVESDTYNRLFTMHGIIMVFFFLVPSIPATLGNFLVPIMIGAKDLAFPKLNLLSWYIYMLGGLFTFASVALGGVDTGWTFYTPYSSTYANSNVMLAAVGVFISGFASILTGLNFLVSIHKMRAPGMTWFRLPLFIWAQYATSLIMLLGTPVVAITILLVAVERGLGVGIFDPKLGGDPVLFQHLFWFYSHPAVYIMLLPGMGVISELISCFSRKPVFGYKFIAFSSLAIAVLGFIVWGHHMFTSQGELAAMVFSALTFLVAIPTAVKVFNWIATMYKGSIAINTPMCYVLGFIFMFTIGGLTGLPLATLATDMHLHDSYYVVAHFHYVMMGGTIVAFIGAIHHWWPKMFGRMYNEKLGILCFALVFIGFNVTFFTQFFLGTQGMPRRYASYVDEFQLLHQVSTFGSWILALGLFGHLGVFVASLFAGKPAGENPWGGLTLEWTTESPPDEHNFHHEPIVKHGPYDFDTIVPPHTEPGEYPLPEPDPKQRR